MKRIIFLLFLAFVCNDLKAQIYRSEVCFYIRAGQSLTENTYITIVVFDGETINFLTKSKREVTAKLKESPDYWDNYMRNERLHSMPYNYNSDLSTYSREVYTSPSGTAFMAFSTDLSSYIYWEQRRYSETIENKMHDKRIDKSELMPNEHLYDFLND